MAHDTINVTVIGQAPIATFTNGIACKNNVVLFNDNSTPPLGNTIASWFWNYGDGTTQSDTSHLQNPFYTYADTGNYQVNLTVTTDVGCKQTLIKQVHIAPQPLVNFSNIIACQNDSALFNNLSTSLNYSPLLYKWNFGDITSGVSNVSVLQNPKHLFSQQIPYNVKLITTNNAGCKDSVTKSIIVKAQVAASFSTTSLCSNVPIKFTSTSIFPGQSNQNPHIWNLGTGNINSLNVITQYPLSGTYPLTLTVNGSNGCVSSITKTIAVGDKPVANFSVNNVCLNNSNSFNDLSSAQSGALTSWNWKLNNVLYSINQSPTYTATQVNTNTVQLAVINSFGCKDSVTKQFIVYPLPIVNYTTNPQEFYTVNTPITFTPSISNAQQYIWSFSNQLNSTSAQPTISYSAVGTYSSGLVLTDVNGCIGSKTKQFVVSDIVTDIAVIAVHLEKTANDFMIVSADVVNYGSTPLTKFDLLYSVTNAGSVKETWTGVLNPGNILSYTFTANSKIVTEQNNYSACVTANFINGEFDVNESNNTLCNVLNANTIEVLNPYPNPSVGNITLPIVLTKDVDFSIDIYDELGQNTFSQTAFKGLQGLNQLIIPTLNFSKGAYVIKVIIEDKLFIKKILKTAGR